MTYERLAVGLVIVLAAVVLPASAGQAQPSAAGSCEGGVVVQGRCLSVDGQATLCRGEACVEFVEESVDICPAGTTNVASGPFASASCELTEPAAERDPACPEGARGEFDGCFIYVAVGPDGCPSPSLLDASGNCRRAVGNAQPGFFCEADGAQLFGRDCISMVDSVPSPCPAGTKRFDRACWRLNGLSAPEKCSGHEVAGTIELASGLCQVPMPIPTGPAACLDGAQYREHSSFILINQAGESQGDGPLEAACVDDVTSIGLGVRSCVFVDDAHDWADVGDAGLCTRYELPLTATCPAGYSIDDSGGGLCRRFEPAVGGQCPAGGALNGPSCVFSADFTEFECPAETARHPQFPTCVAYRTWQGAATCSGRSALLLPSTVPELGLFYGCFLYSGPQPDSCNGDGTIESCFEIREPAAVACAPGTGCVVLSDFVAKICAGKSVTIDMNLNGESGVGTAGPDVILGTPGADVIDAGEGHDVVCAGDGDDVIDGGDGDFRDFLHGGPGDDTISGGFGVDYLWGDDGDDNLDGGGGSDRLFGGPGNDLIKGDSGADRMFGGPGDDELRGMGGQDQMWGEAGNDLMQGNFQSDNMFGGPGDDTMFGAGGKDTLFGDGGTDTLAGGDNTDYLNDGDGVDSANGGRGRDKPLTEPLVSPGNGRFRDGAGCIAETIVNCQPPP